MKVKVFYRVLNEIFEVPDKFKLLESPDNYYEDEEKYDNLADELSYYIAEKIEEKGDISIDGIYTEDDEPIYEE